MALAGEGKLVNYSKKLNAFNASDARLLVEQGVAYENLNDEEKALDSFYDALLVKEENPELNKNLGNFYLSVGNLVLAVLHWKRYLETSTQEGEYFLIQEQFQFFSRQLRMKNLKKQIFDLSGEQTRALYKIYRNMKVDRKSTRLNSSHKPISYAVFCLKKKTPQKAKINHG